MPKRLFIAAILVVSTLWSTQSFARWTDWYNLNSKSDMRTLSNLLDKGKNRYVFKRVQCKFDKGKLMMRIDHRSIFEGGFYSLKVGFWKNLEPEIKQQKKRGVTIISRSDVETNRGMFTCMVLRNSGWG